MQENSQSKSEKRNNGMRQVRLSLSQDASVNGDLKKTGSIEKSVSHLSNTARLHDQSIGSDPSNRSHSTVVKSTKKKTTKRKPLSSIGLSNSVHLTLDDQRKLGARIYGLKNYTTVGKINRKFAKDKQQRLLRNVFAFVMLIVVLVVLFVVYNPFDDIVDFRKMLGLNSPFMSIPTETQPPTSDIPIMTDIP